MILKEVQASFVFDLFKEEISKEFFELRKVEKYEKVYTEPDYFVPNQKKIKI